MTEPLSAERLAQIAARHVRRVFENPPDDLCRGDGSDWPCETVELLAAHAALVAERDHLRAAMEKIAGVPESRRGMGAALMQERPEITFRSFARRALDALAGTAPPEEPSHE